MKMMEILYQSLEYTNEITVKCLFLLFLVIFIVKITNSLVFRHTCSFILQYAGAGGEEHTSLD